MDMGNELIAQREKGVCVGVPFFMNMEGSDCKGIISLREDFMAGNAFDIVPDTEQ